MTTQLLKQCNQVILVLLIVVFIFVFSACGGGASSSKLDIGTGEVLIEYPMSLSKYVKDHTVLVARIRVDGGDPIDLSVDKENKIVTGSISRLSKGNHNLLVEYLVEIDGELVSIATGTIIITVGEFEIIALEYHEFIYTDSDRDGVTNIAELEFGTSYTDPFSQPDSHGSHASENYSIIDKAISTSVVVGVTDSTIYTIN